MGFNLSFLFNRTEILEEAMGKLLGWVAEGQLRVAKVALYDLGDVASAHAALESGLTMGKLVLTTAKK